MKEEQPYKEEPPGLMESVKGRIPEGDYNYLKRRQESILMITDEQVRLKYLETLGRQLSYIQFQRWVRNSQKSPGELIDKWTKEHGDSGLPVERKSKHFQARADHKNTRAGSIRTTF